MFSKTVENAVGKGETACTKQFLIFPHHFQKTYTPDTKKPGFIWESVNSSVS